MPPKKYFDYPALFAGSWTGAQQATHHTVILEVRDGLCVLAYGPRMVEGVLGGSLSVGQPGSTVPVEDWEKPEHADLKLNVAIVQLVPEKDWPLGKDRPFNGLLIRPVGYRPFSSEHKGWNPRSLRDALALVAEHGAAGIVPDAALEQEWKTQLLQGQTVARMRAGHLQVRFPESPHMEEEEMNFCVAGLLFVNGVVGAVHLNKHFHRLDIFRATLFQDGRIQLVARDHIGRLLEGFAQAQDRCRTTRWKFVKQLTWNAA